MNKTIQRYEHQKLFIEEEGFTKKHWSALVKLNTLHDNKYFNVLHNGLQCKQYVGIVQIDGLSIEILPKADKTDSNQAWKNVLIKMLVACGHLKASSVGAANVNKQNLNLLEVYFDLYLQELNKLMRLGLIKQYRKETNNTKALKGKLHFAGNLRNNLVHKERFFTTHQVYDQNHLLHQVLKKALLIVSKFCTGNYLMDACKRLELDFPEVDNKSISKEQIKSVILNRKSASYAYALELARLIILNYSPDISSGKEKMLSLLFDMNVLWETYILKQLKKNLANTIYEVSGQESKLFIGYNNLRPDIIIKHTETNEIYIIDTKWKLPKDSADVADLRQMYTYARFWDAQKVMLLYPGKASLENYQYFKTSEYHPEWGEFQHACKIGFATVLTDLGELDDEIGKKVMEMIIE